MSWAVKELKSDFVDMSKSLSWILRHGAPKENIQVHPGGYVNIKTLLSNQRFKKYTLEDIQKVVLVNDKKRFAIRKCPETDELQIRANQGHSFYVGEDGFTPIKDAARFPNVIHGTYFRVWESIRKTGLSRMNRNHIHFSPGELGDKSVISGMRSSAEIHIHIDLAKALKDGLEFFQSENNVILCPGNSEGILETKYFQKVVNAKTGVLLPRDTVQFRK